MSWGGRVILTGFYAVVGGLWVWLLYLVMGEQPEMMGRIVLGVVVTAMGSAGATMLYSIYMMLTA
jgi:hypothetical protein